MDAQGIALIITSTATSMAALGGLVVPVVREIYAERRRIGDEHKETAVNAILFIVEHAQEAQQRFSLQHAAFEARERVSPLEIMKTLERSKEVKGFESSVLRLLSIIARYDVQDHGFISIVRQLTATPTMQYSGDGDTLVDVNVEAAVELAQKLGPAADGLIRSFEKRV